MKNIFIVCRYGVRSGQDDEIITYSRDEIFDILNEYLNETETLRKKLAYARVKSDNMSMQIKFEHASKTSRDINSFLEIFKNAPETEFYMTKADANFCDKTSDISIAANNLLESIMVKGDIAETKYSLELSIEKGASVKMSHSAYKPAYIPLVVVGCGNRIYNDEENERAADIIAKDAENINNTCRIYKCRDCGEITYIEKSDDNWKIAHGLKPVQRCSRCIQKRKTEKIRKGE